MVDEGVERTASAKMSANVMDGLGVAMGGTGGADGAKEAVAGADEEGLKSGAGTVADLAWVVK